MEVDVIIPCRSGSSFISRALKSTLSQRHMPRSIIVVVDGAEGDFNPLESLSDSAIPNTDITVVHTGGRKGAAAARNAGIPASKSEIVAFLDDDDWWHPEYLAEILKTWQSATNIAFVYSAYEHVDEFSGPTGKVSRPEPAISSDHQASLLISQFVHSSSCFSARREDLIAVGGYDENLTLLHDRDLYYRLLKTGHAVISSKPYVFRVRRAASLSHRFDDWEAQLRTWVDEKLCSPRWAHFPDSFHRAARLRAIDTVRYAKTSRESAKYKALSSDAKVRILFHTINGTGLGHLMRSVSVAQRLRRMMPEAEYSFLTSCDDTRILHREGFTHVKVPSWLTISKKLRSSARRELAAVKATCVSYIAAIDPHVLVADTFPLGSQGELYPFLRSPSLKKILLLNPRDSGERMEELEFSLRLFDRVIIPFGPGQVKPPGEADPAKLFHVGAITYESSTPSKIAEFRQKFSIPYGRKNILVNCGGGGNPDVQILHSLAREVANQNPEMNFYFLSAPLLIEPQDVELPANCSWIAYTPAVEIMPLFDGAITSCGLNSLQEIVSCDLSAVMLALGAPSRDQERNGSLYSCVPKRTYMGLAQRAQSAEISGALRLMLEDSPSSRVGSTTVRRDIIGGAERASLEILTAALENLQ